MFRGIVNAMTTHVPDNRNYEIIHTRINIIEKGIRIAVMTFHLANIMIGDPTQQIIIIQHLDHAVMLGEHK